MQNDFKIVVLCGLILTACGGAQFKDQSVDCTVNAAQSCQSASPGGSTEFQLKAAQPGSEYILVYRSKLKFEDEGQRLHRMSVTSTKASAEMPQAERDARSQIKHVVERNRYNRTTEPLEIDSSAFYTKDDFVGEDAEADSDTAQRIFFVPHREVILEDGTKSVEAPKDRFHIANPSGGNGRVVGRERELPIYSRQAGIFELRADTQVFGDYDEAANGLRLQDLDACLRQSFQPTVNLLGRGFDLDGVEEIRIFSTQFEGRRANNTLGVFSPQDRFLRRGEEPLSDSNFGEILYLNALRSASKACATASHEYVHLLRHDATVLQHLDEADRDDLLASQQKKLGGDHPGLEEGLAHVVEDLTLEIGNVTEHILRFLNEPNRTSFDIRVSGQDLFAESRARGLNILLIYYYLAKGGARLSYDDQNLQRLLSHAIRSTKSGYENLADIFETTEDELFESFFRELVLEIFEGQGDRLFPPVEEKDGRFRGFEILSPETPLPEDNTARRQGRRLHAYEIELPLLQRAEVKRLNAEGIALFRYIVPKSSKKELKITVSSEAGPYSASLIRVR